MKRGWLALSLLLIPTVLATAPPPKERVDLRTETSRTFELGSGRFRTQIYPQPVFYRDVDGRMRPIRAAWSNDRPDQWSAVHNTLAAIADPLGVELRTTGGSALRLEPATLTAAVEALQSGGEGGVRALRRGQEVASYDVFPGGVQLSQALGRDRGEARWRLESDAVLAVRPNGGELILELADGSRIGVSAYWEAVGQRTPAPITGDAAALEIPAPPARVAAAATVTAVAEFDTLSTSFAGGFYKQVIGGATLYDRSTLSMAGVGSDGTAYRFAYEWNVNSIPDYAVIGSLSFGVTSTSSPSVNLLAYPMVAQPSVFPGLFEDCGDGTAYASFSVPAGGSKTVTGSAAMIADVQNALLADWFAVGFRNTNETGSSARGTFVSGSTLQIAYTCSCTNPATPTSLQVLGVDASHAQISWGDASSNEQSFVLERMTNGGSYVPFPDPGLAANVTSWIDSTLTTSTYSYRLRARRCQCYSAYSNVAVLPKAPTNLTGTYLSGTQFRLNWTDASANETGFKVERRLNGGAWSQVATVGANVITYTYPSLAAGTNTFRVRATSGTGDSWYTAEVSKVLTPPSVSVSRSGGVATANASGGTGTYTNYSWYRRPICSPCPPIDPVVASPPGGLQNVKSADVACGVWHGPSPSSTPPNQFAIFNASSSDVYAVVTDSAGVQATGYSFVCQGSSP